MTQDRVIERKERLRMAMDARRRAGWPDGRGMVDVRP